MWVRLPPLAPIRLLQQSYFIFKNKISLEKESSIMFNKDFLKKSPDELQEYLQFKRRHSIVTPKKGKGFKYSRKQKHKNMEQ